MCEGDNYILNPKSSEYLVLMESEDAADITFSIIAEIEFNAGNESYKIMPLKNGVVIYLPDKPTKVDIKSVEN